MVKTNKLSIEMLENLLAFKYLENSYKIFWVKGILQEIEEGNKETTFNRLGLRMIVEAWDFVVNKNISFGRKDRMYRIIGELRDVWGIQEDLGKEELLETLGYLPDIEDIIDDLYEDTPYRLFEAIYEKKLKGKKESVKNELLKESANADPNALYQITDEKSIKVNEVWVRYIKSNKEAVEGWIHDRLCYFLDERAMKQ